MEFRAWPVEEADGVIAAHQIRTGTGLIRKGTVLGPPELAALRAGGVAAVMGARLAPGDVTEDAAAARIAAALAGPHLRAEPAFTGRANLHATAPGLLTLDAAQVDALNRVDDAITLATLPAFAPLREGEMAATVKIIPFAVPAGILDRALAVIAAPLAVAPFRPVRVAVLSTLLPGLKPGVVDKTVAVMRRRLAPLGGTVTADRRLPHEQAALAAALREVKDADMTVIFGASAIADRRDVIPAAIEAAGGRVEHLGMPVDPGNLLLVGTLAGKPVLGAPGCARSPRENGFDWVLQRLLAGLPVTRAEITGFGVGGLLMEIVTRPQPREAPLPPPAAPRVAAVVLAAGRSTRMGGPNKLLERVGGRPLVRIAAEAALASRADGVTVVTGHEAEAVARALDGLDVSIVHNPDYVQGLSTSVRAGIAALGPDIDAALVCLGDMPGVDGALIDRLIGAYAPAAGAFVVVPRVEGRRGNPVLWSRRFFPDLLRLAGDTGGRAILDAHPDAVAEIAMDGPGAAFDVDTPQALGEWRAAAER